MMFPERVESVSAGARVLEVGPGATPHPRSDVFLERRFPEPQAFRQNGGLPAKDLGKEMIYFEGGPFPFRDREFDYVICSHVLEHVEDVAFFTKELSRVAAGGYLEFPTIHYDYIYNIQEHRNILLREGSTIHWMLKDEVPWQDFAEVQRFFRATLHAGYYEIIQKHLDVFFQGFEWKDEIKVRQTNDVKDLIKLGAASSPRFTGEKPMTINRALSFIAHRLRDRIFPNLRS